jgi:hypothetical protein
MSGGIETVQEIADDQANYTASETAHEPKKKRGKWTLTFIVMISLLIGGYWVYTQTIGKSDLVRQVESSGFTNVSYFAGDGEVTASATAEYGKCVVRFISTTQTVDDNSRVARLALVLDNGSFIYDPTPATLSTNKTFSVCGK